MHFPHVSGQDAFHHAIFRYGAAGDTEALLGQHAGQLGIAEWLGFVLDDLLERGANVQAAIEELG